MPLKTHVAAPGSTNSERLTAKTAPEGFVSMCASTEPFRTGIGAVCVEYGRPKWPISILNHTNKQINIPGTEKCLVFLFLAPYARAPRYEETFLPEGKKRPHYYSRYLDGKE